MPIVHARTAEAIEEERRLLYVAVTRARVRLALSWAPARTPGAEASRQRSRFLAALFPTRAGRGGGQHERLTGQAARPARPGADRGQHLPRPVARRDACSGCSAARWPGRRWSRPGGPCPTTGRCTRCTRTSSGRATRPCRSSTRVDRVRDGRSFTTRRVTAIQHGKPIFTLSASFQHPEPGLEHAMPMPAVPPPEQLRPNAERIAEALGVHAPGACPGQPDRRRARSGRCRVEAGGDPSLRPSASNLVWLRVNGELPDDPLLHVCLMTYASDLTLLDTVLLDARPDLAQRADHRGEPGPRDVVPPAVPGRPLAAVRAGVADRLGRPRPGPRRGVHR